MRRKMNVVNGCSMEVNNELLEQYDFEGLLVNPNNTKWAMLVMSSKDSTFTLHVYKMKMKKKNLEYHLDKKMTSLTFPTLFEMQGFLNEFSTFKTDDFKEFFQQYK